MNCRCGCGQVVNPGRVFIDKLHQLTWMHVGGAREIGALEPRAARQLGGEVAGRQAAASGRLTDAATKGGARAREIAEQWRALRPSP